MTARGTAGAEAADRGLIADEVAVDLGGRRILDAVSFAAGGRRVIGLCGPNGSGKSTLLRTLFGALPPDSGRVLIDGDPVRRLPRREIARRIGVVLQERPGDFDFTVEEIVAMGRTVHRSRLTPFDEHSDVQVDRALAHAGLTDLRRRQFNNLSGGEKQRAMIARCIAQDTPVVLLDEPTNHLDIHYQHQVLDLVATLDATVVMAIHDLNLAAGYCDEVYLIKDGRIVADGPVDDVLDTALISHVFDVQAHSFTHPVTGRPQFCFSSTASTHDRTEEAADTMKGIR